MLAVAVPVRKTVNVAGVLPLIRSTVRKVTAWVGTRATPLGSPRAAVTMSGAALTLVTTARTVLSPMRAACLTEVGWWFQTAEYFAGAALDAAAKCGLRYML